MKGILKEYWIEILALLAGMIGIVLVVFETSVLKAALGGLASFVKWIASNGLTILLNFSLSNLFGILIVLAALVFIFWRVRFRIMKLKRWTAYSCPKCGSELHRVHRTTWDRILGVILLPRSRRYGCENSDCGWSHLLLGVPDHKHHHRSGGDVKKPIPQV